MLRIVAGFFMALVLAGPALAQDADYARREALARQVVDLIDPGEALEAVLMTLPDVIAAESTDMLHQTFCLLCMLCSSVDRSHCFQILLNCRSEGARCLS